MAKVIVGPLTATDLQALWKSSTDSMYTQPLIDKGDGFGLEVWGQLFAQLSRSALAVDRTLQSMYILPHSGQTNPSAQGGQKASVTLTFTRTKRIQLPLILDARVVVEEQQVDYGKEGGVTINTGRKYRLSQPVTFGPGEMGPITVVAFAEKQGFGPNNPLPGTIKSINQPGTRFSNDRATVRLVGSTTYLDSDNRPEVVIPQHEGQYIEFIGGSNFGKTKRVIGYIGPPNPQTVPPSGGSALLEPTIVLQGAMVSGVFQEGETVTQATSGATGIFRKVSSSGAVVWFTIVVATGIFNAVNNVTGGLSGAIHSVNAIILSPTLVSETINATWRVLDWATDWGLTCTHTESPSGGRLAMLDGLGHERRIPRGSAETDETYADRISTPADVVSPNAIERAINRIMSPMGLNGCFREVGSSLFPGFYYDVDAFDYDMSDPFNRFKVYLSYADFRAYFVVGVPPLNWGEFGFAYDNGYNNAFDAYPALVFYDGAPYKARFLYRRIWQALERVHAGGVGFTLYVERFGCI